MVRFEFGARPVDPAASAEHIRVCSGCGQSCLRPVFNDPARARWVRFAKSLFLAAQAVVVKPRRPLRGLVLSDTIFRIFESRAVAGSGVLAPLLGLPLVEFRGSLGRWQFCKPQDKTKICFKKEAGHLLKKSGPPRLSQSFSRDPGRHDLFCTSLCACRCLRASDRGPDRGHGPSDDCARKRPCEPRQ